MYEKFVFPEEHGVVFVIWDGARIQLEHREDKEKDFFGEIIIPGGHVEQDETIQNALSREICEEYGVFVKESKKIGTVFSHENDLFKVRHLYLVTDWEGELSNRENKSTHLEASIEEAMFVCRNPLTRTFLRMIEESI